MEETRVSGFAAYRALLHLLVDPIAASRRITETHGDFVRLHAGFRDGRHAPMFHLTGAEAAETVFRNYETFQNGGIIIKSYDGSTHNKLRDGYFSANGAEYDHYVRLLGPMFRKKMVDAVHPLIAKVVREEIATWPEETGDIVPYLNRLVKRLASDALFRDPDRTAGLHAADMVEQHARLAGASLAHFVAARRRHSGLHEQAEQTYAAIVEWGETRAGCPVDADALSALVNAPTEDGTPASPDRIAGYGWTLLGAAYDTSTSILAWLFVLLSAFPEAARRLHAEVSAAPIDLDGDIGPVMELPYLDAVLKEALRLVPPAPIQRRKAVDDTAIAGISIPRKSQILVSAWMTNRDPVLYPDPERFDPSRWEGTVRSPFQWLAFSAGPRRCLGMWFALAFLKTILAAVMVRWRPEVPDQTRLGLNVAITVRPVPGLPLRLRPADGRFATARFRGNVRRYIALP